METVFNNWVIILYSAFIFGLAGYFWFKFQKDMDPVEAEMAEAVKILENITDDADNAYKPNLMSAMVSNFETVNEKILSLKLLKSAWREFSETLLFPSKDFDIEEGEAPAIRNTRLSNEFFNLKHTVSGVVNLRLFNSIPNVLAGLGILGTFIGLAWGISQASSGLASSDVQDAMDALDPLLKGASMAFITSIFGIFSSLIFQMMEKRELYHLEKKISKLVGLLDERLLYMSADSFSSHSLRESRKQTKLLATLREEQQKANDETITKVVEQFAKAIHGAAGKEMAAFAEMVDTTTSGLNDTIKALSSSNEMMHSTTKGAMDDVAGTLKSLTNNIASTLEGISNNMESSSSVFQENTGKANEVLIKLIDESRNQTDKSLQNIKETIDGTILKTIADISKTTGNLNSDLSYQTKKSLDALNTQTTGSVHKISTEIESLVAGSLEQISAANIAQVDLMIDSTVDVLTQVNSALDAFKDGSVEKLIGLSDKLQKANIEINSNIKDLIYNGGKQNEGVTSALQKLKHIFEDLDSSTNKKSKQIELLAVELKQMVKNSNEQNILLEKIANSQSGKK
jgi:hypothetical protein